MKLRQTLSELSRALKRVSNEYQDIATWKGDNPCVVRVDMWGLDREESDRLYIRFSDNENVERVNEIERSEEYLAEKRSYIAIQAINVANSTAAATLVFDSIRSALHAEGLVDKVTRLRIEVTPGLHPEFKQGDLKDA